MSRWRMGRNDEWRAATAGQGILQVNIPQEVLGLDFVEHRALSLPKLLQGLVLDPDLQRLEHSSTHLLVYPIQTAQNGCAQINLPRRPLRTLAEQQEHQLLSPSIRPLAAFAGLSIQPIALPMAENPPPNDGNGGGAPPGGEQPALPPAGHAQQPGAPPPGEALPAGDAPPAGEDVPMPQAQLADNDDEDNIPNDDERFDELYTGNALFSIDHPGRTMTKLDLERNQRPETLSRMRNQPHSSIAILPDKASVRALASRSAVRAALAHAITTLPHSYGVEVYQAAPATGNAADLTMRPHAYLAIEANGQLCSHVDGRWIHFTGDSDLSKSISAAFISLPIDVPTFTGIFEGVDNIQPHAILQAMIERALRHTDLITALVEAADGPGSLIVGTYSAHGLVAGVFRPRSDGVAAFRPSFSWCKPGTRRRPWARSIHTQDPRTPYILRHAPYIFRLSLANIPYVLCILIYPILLPDELARTEVAERVFRPIPPAFKTREDDEGSLAPIMPNDTYSIGGDRITRPELLNPRDDILLETPTASFDELLIGTPRNIKDLINANRANSLAAVMLLQFTTSPARTRGYITAEIADLLPLGIYPIHGPYPTSTQGNAGPTVVWVLGIAQPDPIRESYVGFFVGLPVDSTTTVLLTALKEALVRQMNNKTEPNPDEPGPTTVSNKVDILFYYATVIPLATAPLPPTPNGHHVHIPQLVGLIDEWNELRAMLSEANFAVDVGGERVRKWRGLICEECLSTNHTANDCEILYPF
ncbi:hypothetical protein C8F01DRAFT_1343898 [Mycena amicta]|nr:hypothetical protein C8F01DRAFT_1343898 [Mycena amicta]